MGQRLAGGPGDGDAGRLEDRGHGHARVERAQERPCRCGSRRAIPIIPSRCFSATGASARESRERARALMSIRCGRARLRGSRRAASSPRPVALTSLRPRRATRQWTRRTARPRPLVREASLEEYRKEPKFAQEEQPSERTHAVSQHRLRQAGLRLGHGDRSEFLRGLQQLHRGLPVGKQHRRGRQGAGDSRAPHALDARGCLLPGRPRQSQGITSSPFPACSARTRPANWFARWARRCTAPKA